MEIEQLSIKLDENETHNILGALKSQIDSLNRGIDELPALSELPDDYDLTDEKFEPLGTIYTKS
jgi:hypothetical protein